MPTQYDGSNFQPPAPVATVAFRNPDNQSVRRDVTMLIDSGADVTLVPLEVAESLGATIRSEDECAIIGYDGTPSTAKVVRLELVFCRRTFRGQFLVADQSWGIIGRNVMNRVSLLLNGPLLQWEEYRSS